MQCKCFCYSKAIACLQYAMMAVECNLNVFQMHFKRNAFGMQFKCNSNALQMQFKCNLNAIQMYFKYNLNVI